jgi:hypothetical protein
VINSHKISLPFCAFGAGLGHAAALVLILPVVITLPAPSQGVVPAAVAIHVEVRTASAADPGVDAMAALAAGLDVADEEPAPNTVEEPEDIPDVTGALPGAALVETPDAAELPEAPTATDESAEEDVAPSEVPSAVAAIDPEALAEVPMPSRKPQITFEAEASGTEAAPNARKRAPTTNRTIRTRPLAKKRLLLGGRPPIGTYQYPVPGRLPGG